MVQVSLEDARTGRMMEVVTDNNIVLGENLVLGDSHLKEKEIARKLMLSDTTVRHFLGMNKVNAGWIPIYFSVRQQSVEYVLSLLELCDENSVLNLCKILCSKGSLWNEDENDKGCQETLGFVSRKKSNGYDL